MAHVVDRIEIASDIYLCTCSFYLDTGNLADIYSFIIGKNDVKSVIERLYQHDSSE